MVGERNLRAIADVTGALPLMFAGTPEITDIDALLGAVDGILLTGARANVHPTRFGVEPNARHEPYDSDRDALALTLVETCVSRPVPIFGICRGFQEISVAFGCSLHPEIRELPGRMNHRMPRLENGEIHPDPLVIFADRHDVALTRDGAFARILGCETIRVNSLHGQGIDQPGKRIVVRASPRTGPSRPFASLTRPALPSASSGTPNTTRRKSGKPQLFEAFRQTLPGPQARRLEGFHDHSPRPARSTAAHATSSTSAATRLSGPPRT